MDKENEELLPIQLIIDAIDGDEKAIVSVLENYDVFMDKVVEKVANNMQIDLKLLSREDIKQETKEEVMKGIRKFDIKRVVKKDGMQDG